MAQMRAWFYKAHWRRHLAAQGIVLRKYEVDKEYMHRGMTQAIFRRNKAKLVAEYTEF